MIRRRSTNMRHALLYAALAVPGAFVWAATTGIAWSASAAAQPAAPAQSGPPNALQGFSQNRDQPVKIGAASLEVRDKDKMATFSGNVHLVQGDTTMRCRSLVVFYDADASVTPAKATQAGTPGQQQIKRIEMRGDVIVTQKDQTATGDNGAFEMATNTVTLNGNVVISQGPQVLKGQRLTVNMQTGVSRVDGASGGRVEMLMVPSALKNQPGADKPAAPGSAPKPNSGAATNAPKPKPAQPSGIY